ncbi:MAG: hypothetical protein LBT91_00665 [Bifidobacteriaceae bacterium]|jgi:hypothetical protein|nr:hypothetical protein [Bifidobacteriaceae bacterium]
MVNLKSQNLIFRKLSFKKIGILLISAFLGITIFMCGGLTQVNAANSSSVLPISRGGTGGNSAAEARTNLNAQEQLISGTNIKTVFDQSLLGSGNITDISYSGDLKLGQKAMLLVPNSGIKTINGITFNYNERSIQFTIGEWYSSYLHSSCQPASGETEEKTQYVENRVGVIDAKFTLPQNVYCYLTGKIYTSSATPYHFFTLQGSLDGVVGFHIALEYV